MTSSPTKTLQLAASVVALTASMAAADQVINDDLIVTGSLCVGFDCVNGESFGFDTIRLKENNVRIKFQDTSNSASFPTRDWQITANDSSNGGANKFSIDDIDGSRTPFTIEAGAPSHSLYVDDGGRIGLGTSTPVVEVHVVDGDSPTLRLEQNGSSGFTPQTWDVVGNEANFFVRDATNGSQLPLRIAPGADSNSFSINAQNEIGFGVQNPETGVHFEFVAADGNATAALFRGTSTKNLVLQSTNNGATQIRLKTDSSNRRIVAKDSDDNTMTQIVMDNDNVKIGSGSQNFATFSSAGIVTNIGTCTTASPCDAVFDPEVYTVPSIEEHASLMWENKFLPAVGPTRNGQINMNAKLTGMLNELEHAHIYIEQLNDRIAALELMLQEQ